jgi:hypothetical protein
MKIKAIANICKNNKVIRLCSNTDSDGNITTWCSDGCAMYPLLRLPYIDESGIIAVFDISEKLQTSMSISTAANPPVGINLDNIAPDEKPVERSKVKILLHDELLLEPLFTSKGTVYIDAKYLTPLADTPDITLHERKMEGNKAPLYITIKTGFLLCGVIMIASIGEEYLEEIGRVHSKTKFIKPEVQS